MSNNVNPTIRDALAPFFDILGAADPLPPANTLPLCPRGLQRLDWPTEGYLKRPDSLPVDVFYYGGSSGKRDTGGVPLEPDEPAGAEVQAVWLAGVDIAPLLSEALLSEIEDYALRVIGG